MDNACPADPETEDVPLPAVIVNWYGITDVADLLSGPDRRTYAVTWLRGQLGSVDPAKRLSPLTYVRRDLPPIIITPGDHDPIGLYIHDPTVPCIHAVRLHRKLESSAVPNQLVTIKGGVHGNFSDEQTEGAYTQIWKFLNASRNGLE